MKNLFYAVIVACAFAAIVHFTPNARAEAIASMGNKGGGKIVLTNEVCKYGEKTYSKLNRAYNYTDSGYGSEGCFYVEDETVVVIWSLNNKAEQMRYPAENFTILKRKQTGGTQI